MCRTDHVTIYTPFLVIVLISSCRQATQSTTIDSSTVTESTNNLTTAFSEDLKLIPSVENFTASAINSSAVQLNWTVANYAPELDGFIIIWRKDSKDSVSENKTVNNNVSGVIIGELEAWTLYEFTIAALLENSSVDLNFNTSAKERTGPSAPSQPEIHNTTATNTSVCVRWKEPIQLNGDLDGYEVILETRRIKIVKNASRENTSASFEGLKPWSNYNITLIAFNLWKGEKLRSEVTATFQTLLGIPSVPQKFTALVRSSREILLNWVPPKYANGPLDGFRINYWRSNDRVVIENVTVDGDVTSYVINELEPWTTYNFTIVAYNSNFTSEEATASNKTLIEAPSVPRNFTSSVNNSTAILLTWDPPECPNGPLDGFRIKWSRSNDATEVKSKEVTGNVTSYVIDNLEPWTTYNLTIAAYNSNLTSEEDTITQITAPEAPSVPLNFINTTYEPYKVNLQWEKPAHPKGPIDGYIIIVRTNTENEEFNASETSLTVTNLRSWTIYNFTLHAYNLWSDRSPHHKLTSKETTIGVETKRPELPGPSLTLIPHNSTTMEVICEPPELLCHRIAAYNITWIESNECNESHIAIDDYSWRTEYSTVFLIENLVPATNYSFYVYAFIERDGEYLTSDVNCTTGRTNDGLPVSPENLTCSDSNSTSIAITWEEPTVYRGDIINYTVNYCKLSECKTDIKNTVKYSQDKYLTISDLEHYKEYKIKVSARTSKGLGLWSTVTCRTRPSVPNPVTDFKVDSITSTFMKVTWSPPKPYPGPTNYTVTINQVSDCDNGITYVTSPAINGYNNNSAEFNKLEPYTNYRVRIQVETESGRSKSLPLERRTLPSQPSVVRNVLWKAEPNKIAISWKIPEKPNGQIKSFVILYEGVKGKKTDKNKTEKDFQSNVCKKELLINVTIDKLFPEYKYKFTIYANVDDNGSTISGNDTSFNCVLPAGVPPYPETNITIVKKSKRQIIFELRNDTFSNRMGEIVEYAVIVGTANHIGQQKRDERNSEKNLSTWADFLNNDSLNYQATPRRWNPFNVINDDSMECKWVKDKDCCIHCILGFDNKCRRLNNRTYCNGPLKPGISYGIKIRGYTRKGFAETPPVCASTEPDQAHRAQSGLIVAIVVSLLFLMLLVTGVFIYKKFGIINRFFGKTVMENSIESNDIGFMTVIAKSRPVKLGSFASHVSSMMADSALRFSQEFEELKSISPSHSCSAAQMQENKSKNRWINILPFDHSRVKLLPMDDEPGSDYINASYIPGFNSLREYIATQGPLPNTTDDMWRMIWEHGISMIVMLTQCVERGKTKCEQYWPSDKEESTYGDLKVQTSHESILNDYTIRSFNVSLGERQRIITQMHFTKWPDFGCPENTELLINFVRTVRDRMIENDPNPMLVHCSAGVGRTGTFIAVNRLAQHIEMYDNVDVFHTVLDMRQHRTNMVQTEDQYIYIHECVRDLIQEKLARSNESYKNDEIYGNLGNNVTSNV